MVSLLKATSQEGVKFSVSGETIPWLLGGLQLKALKAVGNIVGRRAHGGQWALGDGPGRGISDGFRGGFNQASGNSGCGVSGGQEGEEQGLDKTKVYAEAEGRKESKCLIEEDKGGGLGQLGTVP